MSAAKPVRQSRAAAAVSDPAPTAHRIVDPQQANVGDPLPRVPVFMFNGVGHIEITGTNITPSGAPNMFPPAITKVVAQVFQDPSLIPDDPLPLINSNSCAFADPDPMGMIYHFSRSIGNMVPGAQGGGSNVNYLVSWALFSTAPGTWVRCQNFLVQFVGT